MSIMFDRVVMRKFIEREVSPLGKVPLLDGEEAIGFLSYTG